MFNKLKKTIRLFKREIKVYKCVLQDKRTPFMGKFFLGLAVGYFFLPIDIIPDFIPVLGYLDDLVILPILVVIGLKFIPKPLINEHRQKIKNNFLS